MSTFDIAFKKTMGHEGFYVNDPDDAGGETYKGVARRYHPGWEGWAIIDGHHEITRDKASFAAALAADNALQIMVREFYKAHYWDTFQGDSLSDQDIANELFDTGVNMGIGRVVEYLQDALNLFNIRASLYPDIAVDGQLGPGTLSALSSAILHGRKFYILKDINVQQAMHYRSQMKKYPSQEKFAKGWYNRVEIIKL